MTDANTHKQSISLKNKQTNTYTHKFSSPGSTTEDFLDWKKSKKYWDAPSTMQKTQALLSESGFALPMNCKKVASLLLVREWSLASDTGEPLPAPATQQLGMKHSTTTDRKIQTTICNL